MLRLDALVIRLWHPPFLFMRLLSVKIYKFIENGIGSDMDGIESGIDTPSQSASTEWREDSSCTRYVTSH